jgi:KDO2-lipid IV(A) lauroyltransferase
MAILYYLILLPLSFLPLPLQFGLGRLIKFILKNVVGYRKKMIRKNLELCFPSLSDSQRDEVMDAFYWNLSQIIVESISAFSLSEKEAASRCRVKNPEVLDSLFEQNRDVIITGGHYANWEAITLTASQIKHDLYALYKPLKNEFMDEKVTASRCKFGVKMISIKDFRPHMEEPHKKPRAFIFGIDQSPRRDSGEWMTFLGRDTMVFTGPERLAKQYDMAVVAGRLERTVQGRYEIYYELLFDQPNRTASMEITKRTMEDVEQLIRKKPSDWLWSHNRWKHKKNHIAQ